MAYRYPSSHCLAALSAKMTALSSLMQPNAHYRNLKWTFEDFFRVLSRPTVEQSALKFRNPASAGKGTDLSELQAHNCMIPGQWNCLLCSMSVIPVNNNNNNNFILFLPQRKYT